MPIDTSIYQNIGRGVKSIADYDSEYAQASQNKLANLMNGAKLDEYRRGVEDQNALRASLSAGTDPYKALMQRGNIKGATDYAKAQADLKKTGVETEEGVAKTGKLKMETANLALTQHRAMLNNVNDPDGAKQWLIAAYQSPDTKFIFERMGSMDEALRRFDQSVRDPASFAKWKQGASMNADELVKLTTPDANAKLQAETSRANNAATVGATIRGQDKTDQRARDFNAIQQDANNIKRSDKKDTADLTKNSQIASFDTMLGTLDRLSTHAGLSRSVGITGALPTMPGSDSANFQAELNTFQSQAFLPMVAQLKGMGALSDAEGKKLTAAVGALDPKMGEKAFRESVARITEDMEAARERMAGSRRNGKTGGAGAGSPAAGKVVDFGSLK